MASETEFMDILNKHQGLLRKICRLYADNEADRQDMYQEMALQLWRSYPNFRGQAKISTWMYQIALYTAISTLKKKRPPAAPVSLALQIAADNPDEQKAREERLFQAIQGLSKVERALVLLYFEEKPIEEIAEICGMTPNHVRVKMHRIREKLRDILNKQQR